MAFNRVKPASSASTSELEQLLEEINFQRAKEMRHVLKRNSCGLSLLHGTTYWTDLFVRHFLFQQEEQRSRTSSKTLPGTMDDDLLFFVRKRHIKDTPRYLPKYATEVNVYRRDSRKLPIGDPEIDWEETVHLNLIVHQFEYTLTLAICTRTSPKQLQVLRRHSQKVYASPSRRRMDTKGDVEEWTFPHICFMVDNFDEVFQDILVRDGEMVCVELLARDANNSKLNAVLFLGSIRYDALKKVYDSRQSSLSSKMAQKMTGWFKSETQQHHYRFEFVRMKGPQGKGHAEMAVTKPKGSGVETPTSEPGFCATDQLWLEDDVENDHIYENHSYRSHQRRLSDPSGNIQNFLRGGWRTKLDPSSKSRSENEGLDAIHDDDDEVSEIEAGDLRDDTRPASTYSSSSCYCFCCRGRRRQKRKPYSLEFLEMYSRTHQKLMPTIEIATEAFDFEDSNNHHHQQQNLNSVLSRYGEQLKQIYGYCTLPKLLSLNSSVVHVNSFSVLLPPKRITPDGTHIYYWCDLLTLRNQDKSIQCI